MPGSFSVRPARAADAVAIQGIYAAEVRDGYASFEEQPPDVDEIGRRMQARPRLPWLVAEEPVPDRGAGSEPVVGYAYAGPHHERAAYRWGVDVSVYLAPGARGRGLGRVLYCALLPIVRDLGYVRAFAGISLPNPSSVGLHQALGFTPVGVYHDAGHKRGRWYDVGWWEVELQPRPSTPAIPREWCPEADLDGS